MIKEGYYKKGGKNDMDKTPRPKAPQGQNNVEIMNTINWTKQLRDEYILKIGQYEVQRRHYEEKIRANYELLNKTNEQLFAMQRLLDDEV